MKNLNLKTILPIVAALVIFIVLTFGYFAPLMKGKVIEQSDMMQNKGMSKEIVDFREKYHSEPLWTNSMFGGMPAYQIAIRYPSNLVTPIRNAFMLGFPTPANMVFSYLIGFFILLLVLKVDPWLSIVGAIGFGFSAFFFLIIDAGHNTQALAIAYMAPVFAGVILVCRGKYLLGAAVLGLFAALELLCNHPQVAYYLILFLMIYVIFEWIARIRAKEYNHIFKSLGIFIVVGALAVGCNITNLWNTYEYAKSTIRGPSELTSDKSNQTSGLDKDYATQWSMGTTETMTLMIPGFKGSSSSIRIGETKSALKDVDPNMRENIASGTQYWGDQPFTSSPYSGAIIVFLFVLGLFIVPGRIKWALLSITIFSILLSWGKNFMWLTDLFLDYFPGYNKFRAVSMILVMAEVAIPILAVLALDKIIKSKDLFKQKINLKIINKEISVQTAFFISFGLTGGLSLLFYLMPSLTTFFGAGEYNKIFDSVSKSNGAEIAQQYVDNIEIARKALFKGDAIRSFFFITLAAAAIWLFVKSTINKGILIPILAVLVLFDLSLVDKRYLNDKNFTSKQDAKTPFAQTKADLAILQDQDPDYRVLNMTVNTFNDASTSYYHKSIGGYHAAKLRRYQELIDAHIQNALQDILSTLKSNPTDFSVKATLARQGVLNMLNTKYIIYNADAPPIQNTFTLGNAWFVSKITPAKNADEELKLVGQINPATTAVVDNRYKSQIEGFAPKADPTATIKLTEYKTNVLSYQSNSNTEQLAVFSEIYYKDGWNAYVDGQLTSHFAADWVLRAMRVPAGKHTIEFKFEPTRYFTAEKISLASSLCLFGFIGGALFLAFKRKED
ncbi:MAG: YfhO family protein [Bacteroidota bacterium]